MDSATAGFHVFLRVIAWGGLGLLAVLWLYTYVASLLHAQGGQNLPDPPAEDYRLTGAFRALPGKTAGNRRPALSGRSRGATSVDRAAWSRAVGTHPTSHSR
ncbi:MAG TPA: hypothetical protein VL523_09805 [Terriglobia bacterium]|nr:hypothetical protein [Terriglobia bacterium]